MKKKGFLTRREIIKTTGIAGISSTFIGSSTTFASGKTDNKADEHTKWWINTYLENSKNVKCDNDNIHVVIESVGRECAKSHIETKLKAVIQKSDKSDLKGFIRSINKEIFQRDLFSYDGKEITAKWERCYCPSMASGNIKSTEFCNCTVGFVKHVCESFLNKPVDAKLKASIARGDKACIIKAKV